MAINLIKIGELTQNLPLESEVENSRPVGGIVGFWKSSFASVKSSITQPEIANFHFTWWLTMSHHHGRLGGCASSTSQLISGCYITKNTLPEERIAGRHVEKTVTCVDSHAAHMDTFSFNNRVFIDEEDFNMTAYSTMIAPLVKRSSQGHNTLAVFGGAASLHMNDYLLSKMQTRGILSQATSQLLNSISIPPGNNGKMDGSVTLSWYKLECNDKENVVDVLKSASAGPNGSGSSGATSSEEAEADELHLRELDSGRGTSVPGLWEVELSTGSDVDAVISHVQKISNHADHTSGQAHSIVQLAITSERTRQGTRDIDNRHDLPGMGKITFLLLSNLEGNLIPSWASDDAVLQRQPWVSSLGQLLQWIESKHASGMLRADTSCPYQKSKATLMLRDMIRAKQDAALLLMLQPTAATPNSCHQWLQLVEGISTASSYCSIANKIAQSSGNTPGDKNSAKMLMRTESPYRGPPTDTTTSIFKSSTPSAGNFDYTHPERREQGHGQSPTPTHCKAPVTTHSTPMARSSPASQSTASSNKPHSLLPPAATNTGIRGVSPGQGQLRSGSAYNSSRYQSPGPVGAGPKSGVGEAVPLETVRIGDDGPALEKSRSEVASLTKALALKSDQLLQSQLAYDVLVKQLHEDGSTLKARDRERFKQVLAELKDYEIYREVMETALARMQTEVDSLQNENSVQKNRIREIEAASRRREDFKDQYSKDLTTTRKQLVEAHDRIAKDEIAHKRLLKEKEEIRVMQVALKADRQKLQKDAEMQSANVVALRKKIVLLETKETQTMKDAQSYKNAHEKLMDRMMTYQEENDLLKAALTEMLEQAASEPVPESEAKSIHQYEEQNHFNEQRNSYQDISIDNMPPAPSVTSQSQKDAVEEEEEEGTEEKSSEGHKDSRTSANRRNVLFKTAPAEIMQPPVSVVSAPPVPPVPPAPAARQEVAVERKTPAKSAFDRRSVLFKGR